MTIENGIEKADKIAENKIADETLRTTLEKPEGFKELDKTRNDILRILRISPKDMQGREKYTLVFQIAYKHLQVNGKFYFDERIREGYWFDDFSKQLLRLQSDKFNSFLAERLEINREDTAFAWIISGVKDKIAESAVKVEPKRFSFYDETTSTLFVNNKPGRMLKIGADKIEEVNNGEGTLFLWDDSWQEFQLNEEKESQKGILRSLIYERHLLDDQFEDNLTIEELSTLLDVYLLSILFRSIILHRPLLGYVGPWGCGKTLMQTLIGMTLFGKNFSVLGIEDQKQDGVIAYITNSIFGVIDNADEKIKWLPDMLAKTATGQSIPRRKLYTTNELISYPTDCFLGITARATPWARPDVISRLLLLKFKQPDNYLDEKKMQKAVLESRDKLLSELMWKARDAIRKLIETKNRDYNIPARLAGFFTFACRTTENQETMKQVIKKTQGLQSTLASEEEETLLTVLRKWVDVSLTAKTVDQQIREWTEEITTAKLFGELCQIGKNENIDLGIKSAKSLGMTLKNNASMLKAEGIRLKVKHSRDGTLWTFTEEKSQERSSQSSQSSPGRDSRSKLDKIGDNLGEGSPKVVTRSSQESSSISTSKDASVTTVTTVTTFPNTSSAKLSAENVQPLVGQKPEPVNQSKENQGPVSFAQNNVSRQPSKFEGIIAHNELVFSRVEENGILKVSCRDHGKLGFFVVPDVWENHFQEHHKPPLGPTMNSEVGVLYNKPISEKGLRDTALDTFKRLSGERKEPVEDRTFFEEMEKTTKFTREQAEKIFQDMSKSGVIFEVRAHFFKKA